MLICMRHIVFTLRRSLLLNDSELDQMNGGTLYRQIIDRLETLEALRQQLFHAEELLLFHNVQYFTRLGNLNYSYTRQTTRKLTDTGQHYTQSARQG